jgi:hypothetical protein
MPSGRNAREFYTEGQEPLSWEVVAKLQLEAMKRPTKNPAAVALGKLRAASMTMEDRLKASRAGGEARAKKLSKAQRQAIAKEAAAARWGGKANAKK